MKWKYTINKGIEYTGKQFNSYKDYHKSKADKKFIDDIYETGIIITDIEGIDIIDIDYEEVKPKQLNA